MYQVEVALDACTRRLKQILERKEPPAAKSRQSKSSTPPPASGTSEETSEEEEERTRQTCFALELLAFLLHVQEAEMKDFAQFHPEWMTRLSSSSSEEVKIRCASATPKAAESEESGDAKKGSSSEDDMPSAVGERREDLLLRMLDAHLYPQLANIVQQIRCEDVLTLQHLLRLAVCRPSPSSPRTMSLPHAFSWGSSRTTQPLSKHNV